MFVLRALAVATLCLFSASAAFAQTATLLADSISVQGDNSIVASGNVQILLNETRLKASRLVFDSVNNTLIIEGPIEIQQGPDTLFLASSAELDSDLRNGILRGARLVLAQQLQLAAAQINRVDGRYTQLSNTAVTSCRICASARVPLWQIRADKVIHDQQERQLYFENARLLIGNVPVFFLPRLRMPDPTLRRATGFMVPSIQTSTRLGTGFRIPYFIAIGDSADLTLTPYLSRRTTTLEARYRQAFARGRLQFDAAITKDQLLPGQTRAYLFGQGNFRLPREFALKFDFELTSDPAYLLEYGFSGKDRLDSEIAISRTRELDFFNTGLINFKTLRGSELAIDDQLPNFQGEVFYERRFFPQRLGGQGSWSVGLEGLVRASNADQLGRDVANINGRLQWSRSNVFGNGMVGRFGGALAGDVYAIAQDSNFDPIRAFITPAVEAELRWPMIKTAPDGAAIAFEPVAHLAWTQSLGSSPPNEDSSIVEFDEGNLLSLSRFPGADRVENGARATLGARWSRIDPAGWSLGIIVGRVYRQTDAGQFTNASGLDGVRSDWLVAAQYKLGSRLAVTGRALIQDSLSVTKAETQLNWQNENLTLASTYSYIIADPAENRPDLTSQMTLDASYNFRRNWDSSLTYLYDFEAAKLTKATIGLEYFNECVSVNLSLSRRFTSSTSVTPTTDFGLSVKLLGFSAGASGTQRSCGS